MKAWSARACVAWTGLLIGIPFLMACSQFDSHHLMRGTVAMKVSDREAHVCMGEGEVEAGDRVVIYENRCTADPEAPFDTPSAPPCTKVEVGAGEVVRTLNEHYSVVRFDAGVPFREGTVVEKP